MAPTYRIIDAEKPRWVNSQSNPTESNSDSPGLRFHRAGARRFCAIRTFEWGILADQIKGRRMPGETQQNR